MTRPAQTIAIPVPAAAAPRTAESSVASQSIPVKMSLVKAHMELGKVRLSAMVVMTTGLGYVVASKLNFPEPFNWWRLFWTCLGTFLAAVGASAFNQTIETRRDARMIRTRNRPLPSRRLSRTYAITFGLLMSIIGVAILCPTSYGMTAVLASANILIYALLYTPMKPLSTVNTLVGAVVGGIPPLIGWVAATGSIGAGGLVLGGILFVWQIPHFLALAWMYREDYARGGFKMLPAVDPSGRLTAMLATIYSLLLVPLCLLLVYLGHAGIPFAAVSFVLTVGLIAAALRFTASRTNRDARRLFFASIIYLPILSITLMLDARGPYDGYLREAAGYVLPAPESEHFVDPGAAHDSLDSQPPAQAQPTP